MPYLLSRDGDELVVNSTLTNGQAAPKVVALASGGYVVIWSDGSGTGGDPDISIRAQLFDADGGRVGGEFLVNTSTAGTQSLVDAVATDDGGFLVTWNIFSASEGRAQFFDATGAKLGPEFLVSEVAAGLENSPTATPLANGNYLFTWEKSGAVQTRLFDGNGQPLGGDVSVTPGATPAAAGLIGGRYALAWNQGLDLKVQLFEANGTAVGDALTVSRPPDTSQRFPDVLALPNGGFVVVWEFNASGNADIKMQMFDAQGQPTSPVTMVSQRDGQQTGPEVALLPNGGFLITWTDSSQAYGDTSSTGIAAQVFNADGSRSGTIFGVNTVTPDVQNSPSLATLADGRVVIAWTGNDTSSTGVRAQVFEPSSGPDDIALSTDTVSETAVENLPVATVSSSGSANGIGTVTYTYLSDSAGGAFRLEGNQLVVADNGRLDFEISPTIAVTLRVTDETGASHDETIVLNVANVADEQRLVAGPVKQADLTTSVDVVALPSGGFAMVGVATDPPNSGPSPEVGAQFFDADGNALGTKFIVNTNRHAEQVGAQAALLSGGGVIAVWTDNSVVGADNSGSSVRGQLLSSSGAKVGDEFVINSTFAGRQESAAVAALEGGGFVVTWTDNSGLGGDAFPSSIKARLFDASGAPAGNEFLVNTTNVGMQLSPQLVTLAAGGFVIAWRDLSGGDDEVRAQLFDAEGGKVGAELLVNGADADRQLLSGMAALPGGGFVIVYQEINEQGESDLKAQLFDAAGAKIGGEFQVNQVSDDSEFWAAVEGLSSGGFIVSWLTQELPIGNREVRAQLFDASGAKVGAEFRADYGAENFGVRPTVTELNDGSIVLALAGSEIDFRFLTATQPVTAVADSGATPENRSLIGNVLANDLHDAGAILRVGSVNGQAAGVGQAITLPSGAKLTLNPNGSYVYDPNAAFDALLAGQTGTDSFSYGLTNGTSATVTLTILGFEPISGDAGDNVRNGTSGDDSFRLEQGGNDSAFGFAGNDGFYFGGALTFADTVDGGPGIDTLAIQGQYAGLVLVGMSNVEVLLLLPGDDTRFGYLSGVPTSYAITGLNANIAAGATLTVQATTLRANENLLYDGSNEVDGNFRFFAGRGTDSLVGGAGNDGFFFGADGNLTGADRINGGGGTDSIALRGNYVGATAVVFQDGSFSNVEVITLLSGHTNEFGGVIDTNGFDYDLTLANGTLAAGQRLDLIASNLRANESARVDARAELDGSVRILAGAGDDSLFGSAGNDVLYGGLGADALDGSAGADTYVYRAFGESTAASRDTIAFAAGDKIDLALIDAADGPAANEAFTFIGDAAFSNVAGQLRVFESGGQWIVEGDVNGDGTADLVMAVASAAPLTAADFIL